MDNHVDPVSRTSFRRLFGREPHWIASAPGRVNLIGEHTDYNDGYVLPMAIEGRTSITAALNGSNRIVLHSKDASRALIIDLSQKLAPAGNWGDYCTGVMLGFLDLGLTVVGFDALIESTVPMGAGLSSSAALEVATATLLEGICGARLEPVAKALLCQRAENVHVGVPCGIMDPFVSTLGRANHALLLDCRSRASRWVPMLDPAVSILMVNTNVRHKLAGSQYGDRRRSCELAASRLGLTSLRDATIEFLESHKSDLDELTQRRARHVVTEIVRTQQAAQSLHARSWVEMGELMYASHDSLRDDFSVSCLELDTVVELARSIGLRGGVYGSRMTGGGFGGCAIALIATAAQADISRRIEAGYLARTGRAATCSISRPADGARLMKI